MDNDKIEEVQLDLEVEEPTAPDPEPEAVTETDPATEAFARLEGEMAMVRHTVQNMARERADIVIPDYTVTLGQMADQLAKRDETQPTKDLTAGSTFRNPIGHSSTGQADDTHELKAWKVIDDAGLRGATLGGAQMSPKHSNFLINLGHATAADLENLGEEVRKRVLQNLQIRLEWEIMRVGVPLALSLPPAHTNRQPKSLAALLEVPVPEAPFTTVPASMFNTALLITYVKPVRMYVLVATQFWVPYR